MGALVNPGGRPLRHPRIRVRQDKEVHVTDRRRRLEANIAALRMAGSTLSERLELIPDAEVVELFAGGTGALTGRVLCVASSQAKDLRDQIGYGGNRKAAAFVGKALGEKACALGIETVCFDRRGRRYHGRIKALADAAREAGLKF